MDFGKQPPQEVTAPKHVEDERAAAKSELVGNAAERIVRKLPQEESEKYYYAQSEEYCQKIGPNGEHMKHGLYILWGPNGERFEEGQYVNGKREGVWIRRTPTQTIETMWSNDKSGDQKIIEKERESVVIDFEKSVPHLFQIYCHLGSTMYEVIGKDGDFCTFRYQIAIEMGHGPWIKCRVPRKLGRVEFRNLEDGLDFSSLESYVQPSQ